MHVIVLILILLISGKLYRLRWLVTVTLGMTAVDILIAVLFIQAFHVLYYKAFPPRKMLLVYEERPPQPLMRKMYERRDKYNICEHVNIQGRMEEVEKLILKYDGVIPVSYTHLDVYKRQENEHAENMDDCAGDV